MATYTLITSNTLASPAASVTFSAIPATFTDLILRLNVRGESTPPAGDRIKIIFNANTSAIYSLTYMYGFGSDGYGGGVASSLTNMYLRYTDDADYTANTFGSAELYIPSYAASTNKPMGGRSVQEGINNNQRQSITAGLFQSTAAISSMQILPYENNWATNSTFYLYGISNA
jgi:hypothetical protein